MSTTTHELGSKKHVFIDWDLIEPGYGLGWGGERPQSWEMPTGVKLAVHHPRIDWQPLVECDREWESSINVYCSLFEDEGRYRLYYECHYDRERGGPNDLGAMMAYAESTDGVNWIKPNVGAISFDGSTDNNLVYALDVSLGRGGHGATVFKDPSASLDQRYKLVHMGGEGDVFHVYGAVSPDGLMWTALEKPVIPGYFSDTQSIVRFDEERGRYVGYFRGWTIHQRGRIHGRRTITFAESDSFESWPWPGEIVAPDAQDSADADIYTNGYHPWPGADAHLMFPAFYQRTMDIPEVHMLTSRDGVKWERLIREPVILDGEPGSDAEGGFYAGCGLVSMKPGEVSLPIGPVPRTHNQGHYAVGRTAPAPHRGYLCLATWRQDGFTSLEAESQGACTTVPFTFSGGRLEVNAWTRFGGEIRIEVVDATEETMSFTDSPTSPAIAGRGFQDCDPISGDALEHAVTWNGDSDLSAWSGKLVRLRLQMRRARLYSIRFV